MTEPTQQQGQQGQQEEMKPLPAPPMTARKRFFDLMSGNGPAEPKGYAAGGAVGLESIGDLGTLGGYTPTVDMANIRNVNPTGVNVPSGNMFLHDNQNPEDNGNGIVGQPFAQNYEPPDASIGGIPLPGGDLVGDFNPDKYTRWGSGPNEILNYAGEVGAEGLGEAADWAKDQWNELTGPPETKNISIDTEESSIGSGFDYEDAGYFDEVDPSIAYEERALPGIGDPENLSTEDLYGTPGIDYPNELWEAADPAVDVEPGGSSWNEAWMGTSSPSFDNINFGGLASGAGLSAGLGLLAGGDEKDVLEGVATNTAMQAAGQGLGLGAYAGPVAAIGSELINGPGKGSMANIGASGLGALTSGMAAAGGMGAMASTGVGLIPAALLLAHNLMTNKEKSTTSPAHLNWRETVNDMGVFRSDFEDQPELVKDFNELSSKYGGSGYDESDLISMTTRVNNVLDSKYGVGKENWEWNRDTNFGEDKDAGRDFIKRKNGYGRLTVPGLKDDPYYKVHEDDVTGELVFNAPPIGWTPEIDDEDGSELSWIYSNYPGGGGGYNDSGAGSEADFSE